MLRVRLKGDTAITPEPINVNHMVVHGFPDTGPTELKIYLKLINYCNEAASRLFVKIRGEMFLTLQNVIVQMQNWSCRNKIAQILYVKYKTLKQGSSTLNAEQLFTFLNLKNIYEKVFNACSLRHSRHFELKHTCWGCISFTLLEISTEDWFTIPS